MLSINALIISIVISAGLPQIKGAEHLLIPVMLLTLTCILSIISATISTRPKVTHGRVEKSDIEEKKTNLLFFGNFHAMNLETYEWGMNRMMADHEYLYSSMNKDLFFLGKVLHRKYKYLRVTYNIFMFGMIASVASFVIATLLAQ
jgi:hypothetical protein